MNKPQIGDTRPAPPAPKKEKRTRTGVPARYRATPDGRRYLFGLAFGTAFMDSAGRIHADVDPSRLTIQGART